jgi:hypothetical protein
VLVQFWARARARGAATKDNCAAAAAGVRDRSVRARMFRLTILHGPHHSAEKMTMTWAFDCFVVERGVCWGGRGREREGEAARAHRVREMPPPPTTRVISSRSDPPSCLSLCARGCFMAASSPSPPRLFSKRKEGSIKGRMKRREERKRIISKTPSAEPTHELVARDQGVELGLALDRFESVDHGE